MGHWISGDSSYYWCRVTANRLTISWGVIFFFYGRRAIIGAGSIDYGVLDVWRRTVPVLQGLFLL